MFIFPGKWFQKAGPRASKSGEPGEPGSENNSKLLWEQFANSTRIDKNLRFFQNFAYFWVKTLVFIHDPYNLYQNLMKKSANDEKTEKKWAFWEQYWGQTLRSISEFRQSGAIILWFKSCNLISVIHCEPAIDEWQESIDQQTIPSLRISQKWSIFQIKGT